jgi:hypothetical protein
MLDVEGVKNITPVVGDIPLSPYSTSVTRTPIVPPFTPGCDALAFARVTV